METGWAFLVIALLLAIGAAGWRFVQHRKARRAAYSAQAEKRNALLAGHRIDPAAVLNNEEYAREFRQRFVVSVPGFLDSATIDQMRAEAIAAIPIMVPSYVPTHKKGRTLSYAQIHEVAPRCLAFFHSSGVREFVEAVVGAPLYATPDSDQSSLSVLCYREAGDHIGWHFDHNFYRGRHFTVLLPLENRGLAPDRLSSSEFQYRSRSGEIGVVPTDPARLVAFEGARVLHRATPLADGELRLILSMTFCTDPQIHPLKELARRIKDIAFFGLRALWD